MKFLLFISSLCISTFSVWAVKLSDYVPYEFEVLFTNPVCMSYKYDRPILTHSGNIIETKPVNVYCKPSDEMNSVKRPSSPQYRLIEWITSNETKEIFAAYLSFSSKNVSIAMCSALKQGKTIKLILDKGDGPGVSLNKEAESLKKCGNIEIFYRGSTGGLGYAHNKILMINPNDVYKTRIVFSSGNLSGGTSINHENWNFVTTSSLSYFSQVHKCVLMGMIEAGDRRSNFKDYLNACRAQIKATPETDISVYFSPVDGDEAFSKISETVKKSDSVFVIAHRLSGQFLDLFSDSLRTNKSMKLILDDDVYWSEKLKKDVGRNSKFEAFAIFNKLINQGMPTKFLETNQNVFQLQHNKFIVFNFSESRGAVFTGAGNLTTAAFTKNFENFYFITNSKVVESFKKQFNLYFDQMATSSDNMPRDYVLP